MLVDGTFIIGFSYAKKHMAIAPDAQVLKSSPTSSMPAASPTAR